MADDTQKKAHHFRHRHGAAEEEPIILVEVIKEEIKSITGNDVDVEYPLWMLSIATDKDIFLLHPDHLAHPDSFFESLSKAEPGSVYEILHRQLPPVTIGHLSAKELRPVEFVSSVIRALNALLKQERLIFPDSFLATLSIPPSLLTSIKERSNRPHRLVANRLLMEMALPQDVIKMSDTVSGLCAWQHAHPRTALCFSGGGIRSATFGLGVTQGLARHKLLSQFDYLSTVSGGGYVGSWLSAWICREGSTHKVFSALANEYESTPLNPEPEQVRHLREFSNYLTPKLGLMSADTWTLIGTYFRNLLLNWVIFIPALATFLLIPRICVAALRVKMGSASVTALAVVGGISGIWAIVYTALHRPSVWNDPEKPASPSARAGTQGRFLMFCFAPLWISAGCFTTLWAWMQNSGELSKTLAWAGVKDAYHIPWLWFICFGASFHFLAWCCYVWRLPKQGRLPEFLGVVFTGAFGGALLWLGTNLTSSKLNLAPNLEWYVCFAAPCYILAFLLTASIFVGLTSRITTDSDREWWARMGAWLLIGILSWSSFCILVLFGPECLWNIPTFFASIGGISSIVTLLLGYSNSTPADKRQQTETGAAAVLSKVGLALAAPLFICCLVAAISLTTTRLFKSMELNQAFAGAAKFHPADFQNLPLLASSLNEPSNAVSWYVVQNLSPATRQKLQDTNHLNDKNSPLPGMLATNLNALIQKNDFYQPARFTGLALSPQSESLLGRDLQGQRLMRFNRLLLQDAFPEAIVNDQFDHRMITHQTPLRNVLIVLVSLGSVAWLLSRFISINRFSLYAVYRNRLIRAYLGASNPNRRANPFSGFDPDDNLSMAQLRPRPFHVVNMALNLVTDTNLAWQQRKAESFTASRLHAGNYRLGYRDVSLYASHESLEGYINRPEDSKTNGTDTTTFSASSRDNKKKRGLTLGTAVAISGAAASPNSGYHSSPIVAVLMTLFNVRLGAWLGNPGPAGNKSFRHRGPQSAVWHVVKEALGLTDDKAKYVYLSDGGHFENLALYEMVLRRVHFIVVSDAGCDPDCALEDLGNAIRKIRIDLGIPIEIDQFNIGSRTSKPESKYCAIGHIDYAHVDGPGVEPGILIYIKPAIAGNEPRDVFNYAESSVLFPHEPTSDQWFTESQFESYRMLGLHIIQTMCNGSSGSWTGADHAVPLDHFKKQAAEYLKNSVATAPKTESGAHVTPSLK